MSEHLLAAARLVERLYALALWLYPARVRRAYSAEMRAVFGLQVADAAQRSAWALVGLAWREARDLPLAIAFAHIHVVGGQMHSYFPTTSDQTPWPAALLSLLPFIVAGPLQLMLSFQPGWTAAAGSRPFLLYIALSALLVAGGLVMGAINRFPRWAYPYPIYLCFLLYLLAMNADNLFQWSIKAQNTFFLFLAVLLLGLALPRFRSFYTQIPRDWTLLTYALYGFVLVLLATIDHDEFPRLSLRAVLPSLLSLAGVLAHLRIRSAPLRIGALLAATYTGLLVWLWGIFTGMVSIVFGILIGTAMLLLYGAILTGILLAPLLVIYARRHDAAVEKPR